MTNGSEEGWDIVTQILDMRSKLFPVLYYATSDRVTPGFALYSKKTSVTPEFVVFNPGDLERARSMYFRRFVHLRDYVPSIDDIIGAMEQLELGLGDGEVDGRR